MQNTPFTIHDSDNMEDTMIVTPRINRSRTLTRRLITNYTTKLDLCKRAILDILQVAQSKFPKCTFSVISWNDRATLLNGNFEEMKKHISNLTPDFGTNFRNMFECVKSNYSSTNSTKIIILTDGCDSNGKDRIREMMQDSSLTGLFDGIIGVGTEKDVDHEFLNHLSKNDPSVYSLTSNENEMSELVHSLCFSSLNSIQAENVKLKIVCQKDNMYIPAGSNMKIRYLSKANAQKTLAEISTLPPTTLFSLYQADNGVVLLSPNEQTTTFEHEQHVIFALDTSGSMGDIINETYNNETQNENENKEKEQSDSEYAECILQMKLISPEYKMLFYAGVLCASIEYTHQGVSYHHNIVKQDVESNIGSNSVLEIGRRMLIISKKLASKRTKEELKALYVKHLDFPFTLNTLENDVNSHWLIYQGKKVFESLRTRYLSTLSKGERFFEDHAASPSLLSLCRTVSSATSQNINGYKAETHLNIDIEEYKTKCKICFTNEIDMIFSPCKHSMCKNCWKETIESKESVDCPFCRQHVTDYLNILSPILCKCNNVVNYIGSCGHSMFCKKKACSQPFKIESDPTKDDHSSYECQTCKKNVNIIKVHF